MSDNSPNSRWLKTPAWLAAQLGKPLESSYGRIPRLLPAAQIIENVVPVVRTHRNIMIGTSNIPAALFFPEDNVNKRHHIGVAAQMFCFVE